MAKSNNGAPGIDGVTFEAIEESGVESFLKQIQDELVHEAYQPMRQQGPFAPRPLQPLPRYYWPIRHPLAFLPFPGVAGYRSDLLQRFLAGTRRASPVC